MDSIELQSEVYEIFQNAFYKISYKELFEKVNEKFPEIKNEFSSNITEYLKASGFYETHPESNYIYNHQLFIIYNYLSINKPVVGNIERLYNNLKLSAINSSDFDHASFNQYVEFIKFNIYLGKVVKLPIESRKQKMQLFKFSPTNDNIYMSSLEYFRNNRFDGLRFIDFWDFVINVCDLDLEEESVKKLFIQIVEINPNKLVDEGIYEFYLASLNSMLGLIEYEELKHSLEESKEAKASARNANLLAIIGIFLTVIGLGISIYFSTEQISQAEKQFNTEQKQYLKEHPIIKDSIPYSHIPTQFINPKLDRKNN